MAGTMVMLLSDYAMEHRMIDTLALNIPKLDPKMVPGIKKRIAVIPVGLNDGRSGRLRG